MSDKKEKINISVGIVLSFVFVFVSILANYLFTKFLMQTVGVNQYGIKSFVNSITSWLSLLSLGLGSSFVRFCTIAKKESDKDVYKINGLYLSLFVIIAMVALAVGFIILLCFTSGLIPLSLYSDSEKTIIYITMSLSIIYVAIGFPLSTFTLIETFNSKFIVIKASQVIIATCSPLLCVPFLLKGYDVWVVAAVNLFFQVCSLVFDFVFCKFVIKTRFLFKFSKEDKKLFLSIIAFCSFVFINIIIDHINSSLDNVVLGFASGPEFVSLYQIGFTFFTYANYMSTSISNLFVPKINRAVVAKDTFGVNKIFLDVCKLQMFLIVLSIAGFLCCGESFIDIWVGKEINKSVSNGITIAFNVGLVILLSNLLNLTETSAIEIQRAYNKHKFRAFFYLGMMLFNLIVTILSSILLKREHVIFGCLAATAAANIGCSVAMNIYYSKKLNLPIKKYFYSLFIVSLIGLTTCILVNRGYEAIFGTTQIGQNGYFSFCIKAASTILVFSSAYIVAERNFVSKMIKTLKNR